MDFTQAALLVAVAFGLTQQVKLLLPNLDARLTQLSALLIGIASVLILAHSTWGHTQIVNGVPLDKVNGAGQIIVGLMFGGAATLAHQTLRAIKNIGENQVPK